MTIAATMETFANDSREEMILRHLPLVKHVLATISSHLPPHVNRDDLMEAGTMGLISATDRYEPSRNVRFHTFAMSRIRGAILDTLRAEDWLPRSARTDLGVIEEARAHLEQKRHRKATNEEIADHLGIDISKVNRLTRAGQQAGFHSLDALPHGIVDHENGFGQATQMVDDLPEARAILTEDKARLAEAIKGLSETERLVISLYYFEQSPLREIAEVLGVTDSRVCQIHRLALKKLQFAMTEKTLVPELCEAVA